MKAVNHIIDCLDKTPVILASFMTQIPEDILRTRRVANKWSIHEQVCHLVDAQRILMERFRKFSSETNPRIKSYDPPGGIPDDYYLEMDMHAQLLKFPRIRQEMVDMLRSFGPDYWNKTGTHDVFSPYNTLILLTHALNVDYAHLFSIEQLALTKPEFEAHIMTVP